MNQNVNDILLNLKKELTHDNSTMGKWSKNYFNIQKNRYIHDLGLVQKYFKEGRLLEIGSAPYHFSYILHSLEFPYTGIDIDPNRQKNFIVKNELNIIQCNIETESFPFQDGTFDFIIFNEVFEHLRINPIQTLREINRVLKLSGILLISTPNLYSIRNIVNFSLGKGYDNPYTQFEKIETLGHMGHVREYSIRQLNEFLTNTGFEKIEIRIRSFSKLKGLWRPFNIIRKVIPGINSIQVHICKKSHVI